MRRRSKNSFPTFGAVVGPQARDKDKEVQTCERHFNYSIYGIVALSRSQDAKKMPLWGLPIVCKL